jgi:hypothetical protein
MKPVLSLMAAALLCAGCGREKVGNSSASASAYTSDSDSIAREDGLAGTPSGSELEAPRLIPAIQNQLNLMARGGRAVNTDNLTAYKNMAGDLIHAMIGDLSRAGYPDVDQFRAQGDSVLSELGGGAGSEPQLEQAELPGHVERMRSLISTYQETMRAATQRR